MFALIADLCEDFSDDGTSHAPLLRSFYTSAALQNVTIILRKIQTSVDVILDGWNRGVRFDSFNLNSRSEIGLIQLASSSRVLYSIAGHLVYSDQVFRNGPWPSQEWTAQYKLLERANRHGQHELFVGGTAIAPLATLICADDDGLMLAAGYHLVGTRSGNNVLTFNYHALDEQVLLQIHDEASNALDYCKMRAADLEALGDVSIRLSDWSARWGRVWSEIYAHHPVPFGVEPGGEYRVGVARLDDAASS